jgi:hypothetical protein
MNISVLMSLGPSIRDIVLFGLFQNPLRNSNPYASTHAYTRGWIPTPSVKQCAYGNTSTLLHWTADSWLYSNTSTFAAPSFVASLFRRFSITTTFPNFVSCFALSSHFVTTAHHLVSFVVQSLNRNRSVCTVSFKLFALNLSYLWLK